MTAIAPTDESGLTVVASAPDRFAARGALTFATAQRALKTGFAVLSAGGETIEMDLSAVSASDSAGLAVLIEWLGWTQRNGRKLRFVGAPQALRAIARISELDDLLFGG